MRNVQRPRSRGPRLVLWLLIMAVPPALSGCGYAIRPPYDAKVRTVYVPIFRSVSFRRDIQLQLTELVIKEIEKRTPFKVVGTPDEADTILEGTINYADKNTVVENPFNLPRQLNAMINVQVKWTSNPPTAVQAASPPVIIGETVNFVPEIGETAMTAFYRTCQNLATQVVDMMEDPW